MKILDLYRIDPRLSKQPWYNEDIYVLQYVYHDKKIANFGVDCLWSVYGTKNTVNYFDSYMIKLSDEEIIQYTRDYILEEIGIN